MESTEMDNWIKELEKNTLNVSFLCEDGYLIEEIEYCGDHRIEYDPCIPSEIDLNGTFTIPQLKALINHMKKYNKEGL